MHSLDHVVPLPPLLLQLLVLRHQLGLPHPDSAHVVLQLLDLVDLALAAVACGNLDVGDQIKKKA